MNNVARLGPIEFQAKGRIPNSQRQIPFWGIWDASDGGELWAVGRARGLRNMCLHCPHSYTPRCAEHRFTQCMHVTWCGCT